jgi:hypothetical protein
MKIYPEGTEFCHAGGWTEVAKLILTFLNSENMTKIVVLLIYTT